MSWYGIERAAVFFLALGLASGASAEGLGAEERRCLADRLAALGDGAVGVGELDAFAVMDPHTGRIMWVQNTRMLARYDFQPGSIFKVITAYAALNGRQVDPREVYRCHGWEGLEGAEGRQVKCWLKAGHGPVNLSKALAYSCNLYFARLGTRMRAADILRAAMDFGFGRSTGSDLPGEVPGSLPAQATVQDSARLAIGQGDKVFVTGVQVLSLMGAVANGGVLYSPRRAHPGGGPAPQRGVLPGSRALRFIRDAMEEASAFGTGSDQKLGRLRMAGKTGTAAWRKVEWRTHGWYMGFWPLRRPMLVIVVFVHKGFGSTEAAALARTVMTRVIETLPACREPAGGKP